MAWNPKNWNLFNNNNNNNNQGNYGQMSYGTSQMKAQAFKNNHKQQTAQTQTLIEAVQDCSKACIDAARMSTKPGVDEEFVNITSDTAVLALNMFAVTCEEYYKESDNVSLDLGRKRCHDIFAGLKSDNYPIYKLVTKHENFMNAALNGRKGLKFEEDRVVPGSKALFENDPKQINDAFAFNIRVKQQFDNRQDQMMDPNENQQLARKHQQDLKEYRSNNKYRNRNNNNNNNNNYQRPKQSDLYYTESGKKANFVNQRAIKQKQDEEKGMECEFMGPEPDIYDTLQQITNYPNAVLKVSTLKGGKFRGQRKDICVQILEPKVNRADKSKIRIRPCYPWNDTTNRVRIEKLELNEKKVIKAEKKHIKSLRKDQNAPNPPLGYKSIEDQQKDIPEIESDGDIELE